MGSSGPWRASSHLPAPPRRASEEDPDRPRDTLRPLLQKAAHLALLTSAPWTAVQREGHFNVTSWASCRRARGTATAGPSPFLLLPGLIWNVEAWYPVPPTSAHFISFTCVFREKKMYSGNQQKDQLMDKWLKGNEQTVCRKKKKNTNDS